MARAVQFALLKLIALYQHSLAYIIGGRCRFAPSCSHYAAQAISSHGALKGSALTLRRLSRCHPWGGSGHDPVPPSVSATASTRYPLHV